MDESTLEIIARASFESYKQHCRDEGREVLYKSYDEQPATLKRSCIEQAKDIVRKAASARCRIASLESGTGELVLAFDNATVERLAVEEHNRWVAERKADGWKYGERKDAERKTSPYLVPWEELPETIKDFDRQPIREMAQFLGSAGLGMYS